MEGLADAVLCDAPCSGFGVIAKKPEIRYKDVSECDRLPDIQLAILDNVSRYVRSGGVLLYSTCTLLPEENEGNVARFLAKHPEFSPCEFTVGDLASTGGCLTLTPDEHGTDGFFMAKLVKE
jgi:16S rRNA (cytosine967-C5)-methyltransferase